MTDALDGWIERQTPIAAREMLRSVSPEGLVKSRPFLGQTIVPKRGSVVASPVLASYDPDPDYFFHWYRDSAIVVDALRLLRRNATIGAEAIGLFSDFVRFSLSLEAIDGCDLVVAPAWRAAVAAESKRFVRPEDELAAVRGAAAAAETRVNPDGSLDLLRWARPQFDGPALRALTVLRWSQSGFALPADLALDAARLVRQDLAFTLHHCGEPCFDVWEEELGRHYYTLRLQAAALRAGAGRLALEGDHETAEACLSGARDLSAALDAFWLESEGFYRSRGVGAEKRGAKDLDVSVVLATLHAGEDGGAHSVCDPRVGATLSKLEELFQRDYAINRRRPREAPAMGRYKGDVYYSGGAYYFATLAAAEFYFRRGARAQSGAAARRDDLRRGDAFLDTVRAFTPDSGEMSEQFDRESGEQTSAKSLAWSYAAFITCVVARRACLRAAEADSLRPPATQRGDAEPPRGPAI